VSASARRVLRWAAVKVMPLVGRVKLVAGTARGATAAAAEGNDGERAGEDMRRGGGSGLALASKRLVVVSLAKVRSKGSMEQE